MEVEYSEEIDRIRANDYGIEKIHGIYYINGVVVTDNHLKGIKGLKRNHLGEIIEEDEGKC